VLIGGMVVAWSLRLGIHLWRRVAAHHPVEDGRYEEMRERWRSKILARMFLFFQFQAVSVAVLGLPFLLATTNGADSLHPLEIAGALVWLAAWLGESVADAQLGRFKRNPANRGRVCDAGLWRYSRHPNYFFEWLIWVGFFLIGSAAPWGWAGIIAPAAILYLLLKVTGVPPTEAQLLRSKGDAYRRYQGTTNAFFPGPPRAVTGSASTT
jgi:steroid 5-alpha reductase family enzyme